MNTAISKTPISPLFITKYKPYFIDDFCLNDQLLSTLKTLIEIDHLSILFVGNTSSGKTTLLYALIREYYGLGKTDSLPENNIMFINNLKEQGIQFFRNEMKTFCQSHSSIFGKKKMVIIDDIDTINEQGQQVFRNYIDKYKHNIHFISVCTNIQKVIESIQSRVHIIQLTYPSLQQIAGIMNNIIATEKIVIDDESKEYLLMASNHSIRIMINHLEKLFVLREPIQIDICKKLCSPISLLEFERFIGYLIEGELASAIHILYSIHDYGYSVIDILDYFFTFVKTTQILDETAKYQMIPIICNYITAFHNIHEDCIELALFSSSLLSLDMFSANSRKLVNSRMP